MKNRLFYSASAAGAGDGDGAGAGVVPSFSSLTINGDVTCRIKRRACSTYSRREGQREWKRERQRERAVGRDAGDVCVCVCGSVCEREAIGVGTVSDWSFFTSHYLSKTKKSHTWNHIHIAL